MIRLQFFFCHDPYHFEGSCFFLHLFRHPFLKHLLGSSVGTIFPLFCFAMDCKPYHFLNSLFWKNNSINSIMHYRLTNVIKVSEFCKYDSKFHPSDVHSSKFHSRQIILCHCFGNIYQSPLWYLLSLLKINSPRAEFY